MQQLGRLPLLAVLVALLGFQAAHAQLGCRTFRNIGQVADPLSISDSIDVPIDFLVGSVAVNMSLVHPRIGALKVVLSHGSPAVNVTLKQVKQGDAGANMQGTVFKDAAAAPFPADAKAAPFAGEFQPAQTLSAFANVAAKGSWDLKVSDLASNSEGRTISLSSWSLTLCPSLDPSNPANAAPAPAAPVVAAADGSADANNSAAGVNVTLRMGAMPSNGSSDGLLGLIQDLVTVISPLNGEVFIAFTGNGTKGTAGMTVAAAGGPASNGSLRAATPGGVLGMVNAAKDAGRTAVNTQIIDLVNLFDQQHKSIKDYINKKLSDYIQSVQAASALTQQVIKGGKPGLLEGASALQASALSLKGMMATGKDAVHQDIQSKATHLAELAQAFAQSATGLVGGMASSTSLVKDLVVAKVQSVAGIYTTAEGAVKALLDNIIMTKVTAFNNLLDKHIQILEQLKGLTGPALDKALSVHQAALALTEKAVTSTAAAVTALPTPSQVVGAKLGAVQRIYNALVQATRVGQMLSSLQQEGLPAALADLTTKSKKFTSLYNQVLGANAGSIAGSFDKFRSAASGSANSTASPAAAPSNGTIAISVAVGTKGAKSGSRRLL